MTVRGGGQAALQKGHDRSREDYEGTGNGTKRGSVAVAREERLHDKGHGGAGDAGRAAQDAKGHATPRDPVLADHVQDRVVEDEEAEAVGYALREDEHLERGGKGASHEAEDADWPYI